MTITEALKTATHIKFTTPSTESEPPVVTFIFRRRTVASLAYEGIEKLFGNWELYLEFEVAPNKLVVDFVSVKDDATQSSLQLFYEPKEFHDFLKAVRPEMRYAVIFGFFNTEGKLIIAPPPGDSFSPLVFDGYLFEKR